MTTRRRILRGTGALLLGVFLSVAGFAASDPWKTKSVQKKLPEVKIPAPQKSIAIPKIPENKVTKLFPLSKPKPPLSESERKEVELLRQWVKTGKKAVQLAPDPSDPAWKRIVKETWNGQSNYFYFVAAGSVADDPFCQTKMDFGRKTVEIIDAMMGGEFGTVARLYSEILDLSLCLIPDGMQGLESFYSLLLEKAFKNIPLGDQAAFAQVVFNLGTNVSDFTRPYGFSPWVITVGENMGAVKGILQTYPVDLGLWFYDINSGKMSQYAFNSSLLAEFISMFEDPRRLGNGTCGMTHLIKSEFFCDEGLTCNGGKASLSFGGELSSLNPSNFLGGNKTSTANFLAGLSSNGGCNGSSSDRRSAGSGGGSDNGSGPGNGYNARASCMSEALHRSANQGLQCMKKAAGGLRLPNFGGEQTHTVAGLRDKQCAFSQGAPVAQAASTASTAAAEAKKREAEARQALLDYAKEKDKLAQEADKKGDKAAADKHRQQAKDARAIAAAPAGGVKMTIEPEAQARVTCGGASACADQNGFVIGDTCANTGNCMAEQNNGTIGASKINPATVVRHEITHMLATGAGVSTDDDAGSKKDHDLMKNVNDVLKRSVFTPNPMDDTGGGGCGSTAAAERVKAANQCMQSGSGYAGPASSFGNPITPFAQPNPLGDGGSLPSNALLACMQQGGGQVRISVIDSRCRVERCAPESGVCSCDRLESPYGGGGGTSYNQSIFGARDPSPLMLQNQLPANQIPREANPGLQQGTNNTPAANTPQDQVSPPPGGPENP